MNLKSDVEEYIKDYLPSLLSLKEFYERKELLDAINCASRGINPNSKMDRHFYHIGYVTCEKGCVKLLALESEIINCITYEDIFDITDQIKKEVFGLGDLWKYDTALRIGFNLRLYPEKIYIHAGVVKGVKKYFELKKHKDIDLLFSDPDISILKPFEAENFLCIWGKH